MNRESWPEPSRICRWAFVEVVQKQPSGEIGTQPEVSQKADQKPQVESAPDQTEADGKKKFVKSYGS